ncbi:hypothetical protein K492DRAFT_150727 [Lichtheimia hyalospora FSU 10163]|nr:hypothetical protein K492DRAFT_150727 [Lichtheimia hyalospora FSU 10163]
MSSTMTATAGTAAPSPSSSTQNEKRPVQRKKKAARACIHCQKAHLTCDDSRPCQRCIKRDLASTCTDGARKKAKYLQDVHDLAVTDPNELQQQQQQQQQQQRFQTPIGLATATPGALNDTSNMAGPIVDPNSFVNGNQIGFDYGFGSSATNLEYSFLSSMLGTGMDTTFLDQNPASQPTAGTPSSTTSSNQVQPQPPQPTSSTPASLPADLWSNNSIGTNASPHQQSTSDVMNPFPALENNNANNAIAPLFNTTTPETSFLTGTDNATAQSSSPATPHAASLQAYGEGAVLAKAESPITSAATPTTATGRRRTQLMTPEMAYASASKPFSYADGYHYLINYVRQKMSREDLMRISRALALFRPSVLASMMNLTEDDLIFTEKCLQRTLLEYEKLISYSGTPTVVWRRTGEIALVGKEFSLLTQWSRDTLLSKKTYIYELMSNSSAVEYWEKYALHAFDNTDSAVYSSCILMSPTKRVVPCTFCFTIKRDIFDLPSVIIGNFLPILS